MDHTGLYVSKDNGLTWTKRVGNSLTRSVYGGRFVDVGTSLSLITKRNQRTDGSTISPDVITIGAEGATTVIGELVVRNNGVSLAGIVNASSGPLTTEAPFTFTNSYAVGANGMLAYGNGIFVLTTDSSIYRSVDGTTWTPSTTNLTSLMFRGVAYGNGIFMAIVGSSPAKVWTSPDGLVWNAGADTLPNTYNLAFGNGVFVAISSNNGTTTIAVTTGIGVFTWSNKTVAGSSALIGIGFGTMSNGTNVFLVGTQATTSLFRSIDNGSTWQAVTANLSGMGGLRNIGFGNDVFMVTSWDNPGKLTISRDGGVTWSSPIQFGLALNICNYVEKKWYIGTNSNIILTSNDDGVTWRRIEGPSFNWGIYVNSIFLVIVDGRQSAISFKKNRSDGTAITSDALTIGREGGNTTIASDTLIISSKIYVPPATTTSEGGLTFSTDQPSLAGTPGSENLGQRSNQVRIQTFSLSIMDPPSYYSGRNIVSGLSQGANSGGSSFTAGEYIYTTGFASLGNVNVNSTVIIGQTYKMVFTLKTTTPGNFTTLQIRNSNNETLLDLGYIGTTYKTYIGYFTPNSTSLLIGVYSISAVQKTIVTNHFSLEKLDSPNVLDVTGKVGITGYVGIGTSTPVYPLHVNDSNRIYDNTLVGYAGPFSTLSSGSNVKAFYFGNNSIIGYNVSAVMQEGANWPALSFISIYVNSAVLALGAFISASDRRIKTNIVDIDDDRALRDLRLLKPKTYTYTDFIQKGTTPVYGFIAQEVKEVLNYASFPITETVPNVYEVATFSGDILTLTLNTSDLSRDASGALFTKLKLKTREEKDEFVNILEIIDEHTLRVDKDLTIWGGQLVGDQIVPGNRIFVYGQEVNDFHTLNKDAIWTVATAALQEVDRQLQAEKQKTALMQTALDALLERVNALEQKNSV